MTLSLRLALRIYNYVTNEARKYFNGNIIT